ncbi:uncharacterized protein DUF3343 [Halanaerobium saccharolyticum]|uniref:Uncharacterized protein DUF3343 n=1 Tax=Halanaerobium saccharolyticum TaxID=43595 RepID=A0A4R7Z7J7_9FIRM|nr:DUF3343 domain-containing protein [Halanaerobium saccharolyticum]RAK11751.1 uncharacterized protein DUF3343 [Halanaerobium saccharolyticum]TDW07592.1 uncharacterized protein DUF3343 [Halanaerobium saccharolyticum]TDX64513.1 uncharacterized protein DUF3343 [Halanaerobium saccharolyticum]
MKEYNIIFTFYSTHLALEFERELKNSEINVKIIPVPRQISSSCGLSGRINAQDLEKVKEICNDSEIEYEDIYQIKGENFKKIFE